MADNLVAKELGILIFHAKAVILLVLIPLFQLDYHVNRLCIHYGVPCMVSEKTTSDLMAEIIRWLNVKMAPMISIHGVLVDVFGEGVLIMGESGIGKSEAALELIKRGHRLVSDDVVEIRRVSDETLIGSAPDITRQFFCCSMILVSGKMPNGRNSRLSTNWMALP